MRTHWLSITVCVLMAVLINAAVAHYCLLHHSPPFRTWPHFSAQWYWDRYAERSSDHGPAKFHHVSSAIGCDFMIIDASPPEIGDGAPPRMMITRAGLPLRSFEGMHGWGGVKPERAWAISIEPRLLNVAWVSIIPCRPLALGMIVNVAFYAGALWMMVFGPGLFWRWFLAGQRRRAQCCPDCGYDLRGDFDRGCPECGWRRDGA